MLGLVVARGRRWQWLAAMGVLAAIGAVRAGSEKPRAAESSAAGNVERPLAIAVSGGRATFRVATPAAGSRTLVIVSALSRAAGPYPVSLAARSAARAQTPPLANDGPRRSPRFATRTLPPIPAPSARPAPAQRSFHLMVRDGDVASASNYLTVKSELRALGRRVQVYVDSQDSGRVVDATLRDLVATFDDRVFPVAARTFGQARDVDGDGRFTILITSWLTRLAGGRHAVDGFVRGADLDPSLAAPFSNHCDMMYLSAALTAGPHLRTVLAHEYTHAVSFHAKGFEPGAARSVGQEEDWLDEALAHLVEDLHGFSRSNLDYRISAFLSSPERYRLVVQDYYAADLFRSHGHRGGTYLFLRWCADRFGPDFLPTLIQSRQRGIANLETATGQTFADLYRQWSVALFLSGLEPRPTEENGLRSLNVRRPLDDWELAGPRVVHVRPGGEAETWAASGTSSRYLVVDASPSGAVEVDVSAPPEAELQVTAVPLPPEMAELRLSAHSKLSPDGELELAVELRERQGVPVELSAIAWEPLIPGVDPHSCSFRRDGVDARGLVAAFGTARLPGQGRLKARSIRLTGVRPDHLPLILKAVGTDAHGRRVAAWAEIPPAGGDDEPADPPDDL